MIRKKCQDAHQITKSRGKLLYAVIKHKFSHRNFITDSIFEMKHPSVISIKLKATMILPFTNFRRDFTSEIVHIQDKSFTLVDFIIEKYSNYILRNHLPRVICVAYKKA